MKTKKCSRCKIPKPLDDFDKKDGTKDNHRSDCKKCRKEKYLTDKLKNSKIFLVF
jgi:hypothetical protein